jgi:hypothetical protein
MAPSESSLGVRLDVETCLWCKKTDDTESYSARLMLACECCDNAYAHLGCDAVRRGAPQLTAQEVKDQPWFCSRECKEVRRSPLVAGGPFSLLRCSPAPLSAPLSAAACASTTCRTSASALAVRCAPLQRLDQ